MNRTNKKLKKVKEQVETTDKSSKNIGEKIPVLSDGASPGSNFKNRVFSNIIPNYTPTLKTKSLNTEKNGASHGSKLITEELDAEYGAFGGSETYSIESSVNTGAFVDSKFFGNRIFAKGHVADKQSEAHVNEANVRRGGGANNGSKFFGNYLRTDDGFAAEDASEAYFKEANTARGSVHNSFSKGYNLKTRFSAAENNSKSIILNLEVENGDGARDGSSVFSKDAHIYGSAAIKNSRFVSRNLNCGNNASEEGSEVWTDYAKVVNSGAKSGSKFSGNYLNSGKNAAQDNSLVYVKEADLGASGAVNNSKFFGEILRANKAGAMNQSKLFVSKEVNVGEEILKDSFFSRVAGESISAGNIESNSYRSLIAADSIELKNEVSRNRDPFYKPSVNLITPDKKTAEQYGFIIYNGNDWSEAKEFLRDRENSVALDMFSLRNIDAGKFGSSGYKFRSVNKEDWVKAKDFLIKNKDSKYKRFKIQNRGIDSIENLEQLKGINKKLKKDLEGLTYNEIDKEYDSSIEGFNELKDNHFMQLLKAKRETFEKSNRKSIEDFGDIYRIISKNSKEKLQENLNTRKDKHKVGKDLVEIAKKFGGGYSSFLPCKDKVLEEILHSKGEFSEEPSEEIKNAPEYENLKQLYRKNEQDLQEISGLYERTGLREIKEKKRSKNTEWELDTEKKVKGLEYQREKIGKSLEKSENPGYNIENNFEKRKKIVNTFKPKDYSELEEILSEEVKTKKRDYTLKAVDNAGRNKVQELYQNATGDKVDPDELSQNELEALRVYKDKIDGNEGASKLLKHGDEVYHLPENQKWLEANGFNLEDITEFEYKTSNIDSSNSEENKENKKQELLNEMYQHLERFNELTGYNYQAQSVEDFEKMKDNINLPKDEEAQRLYRELVKEKPNAYRSKDKELEGQIPEELKIRVASPMETINLGNYFVGSCLGTDGSNNWSAPSYAVDVNKPVLYAYNQKEQVMGRISLGINNDGQVKQLSKVYSNTPANIDPALKEAAQEYASHLGLNFAGTGDEGINPLEAKRFYADFRNDD